LWRAAIRALYGNLSFCLLTNFHTIILTGARHYQPAIVLTNRHMNKPIYMFAKRQNFSEGNLCRAGV
jgi:hypothetical protein